MVPTLRILTLAALLAASAGLASCCPLEGEEDASAEQGTTAEDDSDGPADDAGDAPTDRRSRRKAKPRRRTRRTAEPAPVTGPVCARMCKLAPVDPFTGACVARYLGKKGYKVPSKHKNTCSASAINDPDGCRTCAALVGVKDAHCQAAHDACF